VIREYKLCFLGFGNVNRALVRLLAAKDAELRERHGIAWRITGIASRRLGWVANAGGMRAEDVLQWGAEGSPAQRQTHDVKSWLAATQADVLFEATSLNAQSGQPAIDHLQAALEHGAHAITANKGPVVHAYDELRDLAAARGRRFLFESAVMDGAPIFSLFRENLPVVQLRGFRGVLNSTTNVILSGMERGLSFADALKEAQTLGVAETDATDDIDGWDATVKVAALVRVLMGEKLALGQIQRAGIGGLTGQQVQAARAQGRPYKLVCRARRGETGVVASVGPEQVELSDPLALVQGTSSVVCFETDIFPGLAIVENNPGLETTAYGMLADFVRAVGT
jgi:homoserine dehydrogenase